MGAYYLDAQMYDYLACEEPALGRHLVRAIRAGKCQVLGSIELLEELAGLYRKEQKLDRVLSLFWDVVQGNVLDYAFRLFGKELAAGAPISLSEARLDPDDIKELHNRKSDVDLFSQTAFQVQANKDRYAKVLTEMGEEGDARIAEICRKKGVPVRDFHRVAKDCRVDEETVTDWAHYWFPRTKTFNVGDLPCVRAWVSITVARTYRRHSGPPSPRDRASDLLDNSHYVVSAVTGCLVTRDRRLLNTVDRIRWRPVPVMSEADFADTIRGM